MAIMLSNRQVICGVFCVIWAILLLSLPVLSVEHQSFVLICGCDTAWEFKPDPRHYYKGIPFNAGYVCPCWHIVECKLSSAPSEITDQVAVPTDLGGPYARVHILQSLVKGSHVPDGQHVATFAVHYTDASVSQLELVAGVNTADSFYDYNGDCQQHERVKPAYTYHNVDPLVIRSYRHFFYASMLLDATKVVAYFSLQLDNSACTGVGDCQDEGDGALRVVVHCVTFERP